MRVCVAINLNSDLGQIDGLKSRRETKPTQSERKKGGGRERSGFGIFSRPPYPSFSLVR